MYAAPLKYMYRMPFVRDNVPHLVLEPNHKCNLQCTACYKNKDGDNRPLSEIIKDIDFALSTRKLDTISILGGEPTLHPDLPDIIRYISEKDVEVRILSNGLTLDDALLDRYKEAGLDNIMLHIDSMQKRPDLPPNPTTEQINKLRDRLFGMVAKKGIRCGLAITLYRKTLDKLAEDIKYVLSSKHVTQMLITEYGHFPRRQLLEKYIPRNEETEGLFAWFQDSESQEEDQTVTNADVEDVIYNTYGFYPTAYVSSSRNEDEKRWIYYFIRSISYGDGGFAYLPTEKRTTKYIVQAFEWIHKYVYGKYSFLGKVNILDGQKWFTIIAALVSINPVYVFKTLSFMASSFKKGAVYTDNLIVFQQYPGLTDEGALEHCQACPDATVRNGRLVPVCVADMIYPKDLDKYSPEVQRGFERMMEELEIEL